jgi:hypothetical protein
MHRSMLLSRKLALVGLAIATTFVFTAVVMPALGGPTAVVAKKKKKKARRGPAGPQGAQGAQGPQGLQGPEGPAGPSASTTASATGPTAVGGGDTTYITAQITTTVPAQILGNASVSLLNSTGNNRYIGCFLKIDGATASHQSNNFFPNGVLESATASIVGAATEPAGMHTVTAVCTPGGGSGTVNMTEGNLNVVAVAS